MSTISRIRQDLHFKRGSLGDSSAQHQKQRGFQLTSRTKWSIYLAVVAFCIYRLIVFQPQPLDAPGTLRPILYAAFKWFVGKFLTPEDAFTAWSGICSAALLVPVALAVLYFARRHGLIRMSHKAAQVLCSNWLFFGSIAACLILCRFPTLIQKDFNPDEGAFLAAANKLFFDPNFFHSVDCQTNGPLNVYPLMMPAIFGISPDLASGRILVIVIIVVCAVLFYRTVFLLAPTDLARFSVLPFVTAMAVFNHSDLRHYSSEYVPVLLISVAVYLAVRIFCNSGNSQKHLFSIGMLSTAAFFSKMQSVPIVLSVGLVALAHVYLTRSIGTRWRPVLVFVAGTVPLVLINLVMCLVGGVWKDFWISYIRANVYYAQMGDQNLVRDLRPFIDFLLANHESRSFLFTAAAFGIAYVIERVWRPRSSSEGLLLVIFTGVSGFLAAQLTSPSADGASGSTYLAVVAMWIVPICCAVLLCSRSLSISSADWFGSLSLLLVSASLYAIYATHRPFPHYLLFLFFPLSAAMSWMLIKQAGPLNTNEIGIPVTRTVSTNIPRGLPFMGLLLVLTLAYQTYEWSFQDPKFFTTPVATIRTDEGDFVRSVTDPGPTVFVWGWNSMPFIGAGRVPATRDLQILNCFRGLDFGTFKYYPNRQNEEINNYYLKRMMHDLHANKPELFVDALSFASWVINDRKHLGFEQFPEVDRFVRTNYVFLTERYEPGAGGGQGLERYYLRRDLLAKSVPANLSKSCAPRVLACFSVPPDASSTDDRLFAAQVLPQARIPSHALIEAEFVPIGLQAENATVFNNEAVARSFRGFRFQTIGGDRYRLLLGLGDRWAFSKSVFLPRGKRASISIEIERNYAYFRCNGIAVDDIELSSPVADSPGPITLGSWIDGQCRFSGAIPFFQIVNLNMPKTAAFKRGVLRTR